MPVCHRARAQRCTKVRGNYFNGWCSAKQERYFGWKFHLIYDIHGIPMRFMVLPARPHDITAVHGLAGTMPFGSIILGDRGYICEKTKHQRDANCGVQLIARQRVNMIPNTPAELQLLRMHRKRIETFNSQLEKMGITCLHARNTDGVMLKLCASLSALSLSNYR